MTLQAIIFDAYGTLFDVYSIGVAAEKLFPGKGDALAAMWRDKQIEYTRLRTMCSMYKPFWEVTQDALVFCCKKLGLELDLDAQHALMAQYATLQSFPKTWRSCSSCSSMVSNWRSCRMPIQRCWKLPSRQPGCKRW